MTPPLGPLEFKDDDNDFKSMSGIPFISIDKANRLLAERLEKLPLVFAHYGDREWHVHDEPNKTDRKFYTPARLIIQEREGK